MASAFKEISWRGKLVKVPALEVEDRTVLVLGKWLRIATIHDEVWLEGDGVRNPEAAITKIAGALSADIFTFAQKLPETQPKYSYRMEWDNVAAIPLTTYTDWWENKIPQESRKNVRRGGKRGVTVRIAELDDEFIRGIVEIYNETPIRQGKPFPKYGQDFAAVKRDVDQLLDRSVFIGAYLGAELIGFIKLVFIGNVASILSINSKNGHFDKRPTNMLMAKAVEIAAERRMTHLIYGRYAYGNKAASPLTEFKRRNGFVQIDLPRYYIPLNWRGRLMLAVNAHRGLVGMLPAGVVDFLVKVRARIYALRSGRGGDATAKPAANESDDSSGKPAKGGPDEKEALDPRTVCAKNG
jgi:hypothetical protein